jgi:hypothetical protein
MSALSAELLEVPALRELAEVLAVTPSRPDFPGGRCGRCRAVEARGCLRVLYCPDCQAAGPSPAPAPALA